MDRSKWNDPNRDTKSYQSYASIKNDLEQKFLSFDIYDFVLILVVIIHIWINPYSNSEDEFATNNVYDFMTCTFKEVYIFCYNS